MSKDRRDESTSSLSEVGSFESRISDDDDISFGYKLDPHESVARCTFSDSSDNESIPCSDFPGNTQPGGKFFSADSFLLYVS